MVPVNLRVNSMLILSVWPLKNKVWCNCQTMAMVITLSDRDSLWRFQLRAGHEKCTAQVLPRLGEVPEDWLQVLCKFSGVLGHILLLQPPSLLFCPQSPGRRTGRVSLFTHPRAGALIHTQGTIYANVPSCGDTPALLLAQLQDLPLLQDPEICHQDSLGVARQSWKFRLDCATLSWLNPD